MKLTRKINVADENRPKNRWIIYRLTSEYIVDVSEVEVFALTFPKQALVSTCLQYKFFGNAVVKG